MKVNHGREVWHVYNVLNIAVCVFLIAIKLNKPS
jgi:hypothetical protein